MIGFVNGEKLLTDSDLPPQWNLLSGTSDWSGNWENINNSQYSKTAKRDSNGNMLLHYQGAWVGINKVITAFANEIYAFSFNITNAQINGDIAVYSNNNQFTLQRAYLDGKSVALNTNTGVIDKTALDKKEHRISIIGQVKSSGDFSLRLESTNNDNSIDLSSMKLEHGDKSTQWMPAVADLMLKNQNGVVD